MTQHDSQTSGECWQLWLDGASDLIAVWDMPPHHNGIAQHRRQRDAIQTVSQFFGAASEAQARAILTSGWPQGAALVDTLAKQITDEMPPPKSRRRTRKWADDGDEVSHERMAAGQELVWLSSHRKLRHAMGLVEIVCEWGSSCGASVKQLQWSGAAALALCDMLEKADYSTELALVGAMRGDYTHEQVSLVRIDLKQMGQHVDLEKLAAVAVYPAAWRIYGLCAFQQSPFGSGGDYNSHPHSNAFAHEPNGMWAYRPNVMTLQLRECHTEQQAKDYVLDALRQLDSMVNPQDAW